jgi:uncharacterized protein YuzE
LTSSRCKRESARAITFLRGGFGTTRYDAEADAAYIYLREIGAGEIEFTYEVAFTGQNDIINLDFDLDGHLIGVEVLSATSQLPAEILVDALR